MRVTQKEIAAKLGISQSLVAGVLGEKSGVWVSPEKRELILSTASALGYRPNAAARMLRHGRTQTVAFFTLRSQNGEQAQVIGALAAFLQANQYELKLKLYTDPAELLMGLEETVNSGACDAVFLNCDEVHVEQQAALAQKLNMPFVVKGRFEESHPDWPQIDFDHERMMAESVRFLVGLGHQRIAYLGYATEQVFAQRLRTGFVDAMRNQVQVDVDEDFLGFVPDPHMETAASHMDRWLGREPAAQPTAVVIAASSESTWNGVEMALAHSGRKLGFGPHDLASAGLNYGSRPLLFGDSQVFSDVDSIHLTDIMCSQLLLPILRCEQPERSVIRIFPDWHQLGSLGILDYMNFKKGTA